MNQSTQPVTLAGAAIILVDSAIALAAYVLEWDDVMKVLVGTFGAAAVTFIALAWAHSRVTPTGEPKIPAGTPVKVLDANGQLTGDSVIVQPTPPGSVDVPGTPPDEGP